MSFISTAFSGAGNNFTQERAYAPGTQAMTMNFQPAVDTAGQNYGQANSGLNSLAAQLQQQMQGGGPNLANALLQQATGQNVANQAALMAGQRGASQNAGLMARQIGQQGAQIQQQSAGQAAINRLQQQLQAQSQLGQTLGLQGQLANQNLSTNLNGFGQQNANIAGVTQNYNNQGMNQAQQNAQMNQGIIGGVSNAGMAAIGLAGGGQVPQMFSQLGQGSNFGFNFASGSKPMPMNPMEGGSNMGTMAGGPMDAGGMSQMSPVMMAAKGGQVPSLPFSPVNMKQGGAVPGQPMHPGKNMPSNDTVPAMLTPQEIVLPLSVTQHPNAPEEAAKFVMAELAKRNKR